jgi:hypothetical protein
MRFVQILHDEMDHKTVYDHPRPILRRKTRGAALHCIIFKRANIRSSFNADV